MHQERTEVEINFVWNEEVAAKSQRELAGSIEDQGVDGDNFERRTEVAEFHILKSNLSIDSEKTGRCLAALCRNRLRGAIWW